MEIKLSIDATPELVRVLTLVAEALGFASLKVDARALKEAIVAQMPIPDIELPRQTTIEALRALGASFIKAGKRDALKALLTDFGIAKIPECPAERYSELEEVLTNAL